MAESSDFARRVFVEDVRSDGKYLRMTWHPELPGFIVSNWDGDVCVGATRVPLDAAPRLIQLLTNGMADALVRGRSEHADGGMPPHLSAVRRRLDGLRARFRGSLRRVSRRSTTDDDAAHVIDLEHHRARVEREVRWSAPRGQS